MSEALRKKAAKAPKPKRYKAVQNKEAGWTECFFDAETHTPKHVIPLKSRSWTLQYGMSLMAHRWKAEANSKQDLEELLLEWGEEYNKNHLSGNVYSDVVRSSAKKAADLAFKGRNSWYKLARVHEDGKVISFRFDHTFNPDRY